MSIPRVKTFVATEEKRRVDAVCESIDRQMNDFVQSNGRSLAKVKLQTNVVYHDDDVTVVRTLFYENAGIQFSG